MLPLGSLSKRVFLNTPNKFIYIAIFHFRGTILERQTNKIGHAEPGSVALPGIMRAGGPGATQFDVGQMQAAQYGTVSGQAKSGHQAPMVRSTSLRIV